MIRKIYDKFVRQQMEECMSKCRDDLRGMTRFVTWDVDGKGGSSALYRSLPTPKKMVEIYSVAVENKAGGPKAIQNSKDEQYRMWSESRNNNRNDKKPESKNAKNSNKKKADRILDEWNDANGEDAALVPSSSGIAEQGGWNADEQAQVADYYDLLQLTEEMLAGRNANRTSTVVTALVQFIIRSWRDHYARTVAMKFNCFFLMPFLDEFPAFLRQELDVMYESGVGEMFDIAEARRALQNRRRELMAECDANAKLQRRFDLINAQLRLSSREVGDVSESLSTGAWGEADDFETPFEQDPDQDSSPRPNVGGIPRPPPSGGKRPQNNADKRRRYPGIEDLDMVRTLEYIFNACLMLAPGEPVMIGCLRGTSTSVMPDPARQHYCGGNVSCRC